MRLSILLLIGIIVATVGCTGPETPTFNNGETSQVVENGEPAAITVQHCLIGFQGSVGGKSISRSQEEAGRLAAELLQKARAGADFGQIVKANTDDSPPGIYKMANSGFPANKRAGVFSRDGMVPAFGNVGFKLKVGEYGLSEYNPGTSPYGWHIIKRLE